MKNFLLLLIFFSVPVFSQINRMHYTEGSVQTSTKSGCPDSLKLAKSYTDKTIITGDTIYPLCSNDTILFYADQSNYGNPLQSIFTPCVEIYFPFLSGSLLNTVCTITINENGNFYGCLGPSLPCFTPPANLTSFYWTFLDSTKAYDLVFCKNGSINGGGKAVTVRNCWTTIPIVPTFTWSNSSPVCFTVSVTPNNSIGNAYYTCDAPNAIKDGYNGITSFFTDSVSPGKHWITYHWRHDTCVGIVTDTFFVSGQCVNATPVQSFKQSNIAFYPNPFTDIVYVENENATKLEIYNSLGEIIHTVIKPRKEINLKDLPVGIYIFKISIGDNATRHLKMLKN